MQIDVTAGNVGMNMARNSHHRRLKLKTQRLLRLMILFILVPAGVSFTALGIWQVVMNGDLSFLVFLLAGPFCILFTVIALLTYGKWQRGDLERGPQIPTHEDP